jgi:invasion protein IalB
MTRLILVLLTTLSALATAAEPKQDVLQTWGDWSKICTTSDDDKRVCQIVQSANQNESGALVFQTAVGYVDDTDKPVMYLTAPLGIFLPRGITVVIDDKPGVTATVQRCDGNGCLGLLVLEPDFVDALKKAAAAKLVFAASAKQNVSIPLSLNGFAAALEGLNAPSP